MTDVQTAATKHHRHRRTIARITATLAVVGLVLAGCSSSKKSSSVAAPAPISPASTTAPTVPAPTTAATSPATTSPAAPTTTAASPVTAPPTTATSSGAAPSTTAPSAPTPVAATEKEYVITLSRTTFTPGAYTFTIKNIGQFKHDLVFNGPGLSNVGSALLLPGSTGSLTVTLAAGTYDVFCGVPTHKAKGMDLHITVA